MKTLLQKVFINTLGILIVAYLVSGLQFNHHLETALLAAVTLAIINAFFRPLLKILLLPINVITLGIFGWFINVFLLFLTTLIVPGFRVIGFSASILGTNLVFHQFTAYIAISLLLSFITTLTSWLIL